MTSAAILFSGSLPSKALRLFRTLNCATISIRTFFRHQSLYLQPAVNRTWEHHQGALLQKLKDKNRTLVVGGDGRSDSPGHCAKYGTYSLIELNLNKLIDFKLIQVCIDAPILEHSCIYNIRVYTDTYITKIYIYIIYDKFINATMLILQSNEVGGSYHMEKEGLIQVLQFLQQHDLEIDTLVTDRHGQIQKFMREKYPEIKHRYDVWHVAKSKVPVTDFHGPTPRVHFRCGLVLDLTVIYQ